MPGSLPDLNGRRLIWLRLRRITRGLALIALVAAGAAVILLARGGPEARVQALIGMALGAGLLALVATALMTIAYAKAAYRQPPASAAKD